MDQATSRRRHASALEPGARLGPYHVLGVLGAGGMGEVWRARDTRLAREVALKVLPRHLASDADALARFEREAKALAALSHPCLLALHDFGVEGGIAYAVTELLEGESLGTHLKRGPLPVRKAVEVAIQVAQGLAAAHDKGIVHRDLKPENLFLLRDGRLKVLDFGLAKLTEAARDGAPTGALDLDPTDPGTIVGTAAYMSPEQARGAVVDHRSDIFSLGSVLYEMLTGVRAFRGASVVETMHAVLTLDPLGPEGAVGALPPAVQRLLAHCLEKQPEQRFQSTRDLAFQLEALSTSSPLEIALPPRPRDRARRRRAVIALLLVAACVAAGLGLAFRRDALPPLALKQLSFRRGFVSTARFTAAGTIVFGAAWEGQPLKTFQTRRDGLDSMALALPDADLLGVSRRGELALSLGRRHFSAHMSAGTLARAPLEGGAPREVLEGVQEADWSPDGSAFAVVRSVEGRHRLEYPAGTLLYEAAGWISHARVSPDGERVAFVDHPIYYDDQGRVVMVDRARRRTELSRPWYSAQGLAWRPDGREVWFTAGDERRELRAADLAGHERRVWLAPGQLTLQDIGPDGVALLTHGTDRAGVRCLAPGATRERDLSWLDYSILPRLARDGRALLFSEAGVGGGTHYSAYLRPTDGAPAVRLGEGFGCDLSADGRRALTLSYTPRNELTLMPTGAGEPQRLTLAGLAYDDARLYPDERRVLVQGRRGEEQARLFVQDIAARQFAPLGLEGLRLPPDSSPIAPDGEQVVAQRPDRSLVLLPAAGGQPVPLSALTLGDQLVGWTADGRGLRVYRQDERPLRVWEVDLASGRRRLFRELAFADTSGIVLVSALQVTPDGRAYAYRYQSVLNALFAVEGLR